MATESKMTSGQVLLLKAAIRNRDGHCCVRCGMTEEDHRREHGHDLEVHRKIPGAVYSFEICETLCHDCHIKEPKLPRGSLPKNPNRAVNIRMAIAESADVEADRLAQDFTQFINDSVRMRLEQLGA